MRYTISRESDLNRLRQEVERLANENGWEPVGGVAVERSPNYEGHEVSWYLQALVLRDND
jgi:hypothetical protein